MTVAVTVGFWLRFEGMPDQLSALYGDLLEGSYDCVDRVVLNAYFGRGQFGGACVYGGARYVVPMKISTMLI